MSRTGRPRGVVGNRATTRHLYDPPLELIRQYLRLDAETGQLFWLVDLGPGRPKAGDVAGCPNAAGYIVVRLKGQLMLAHRIVWALDRGAWPTFEVDHEDQDKGNNRPGNLRPGHEGNNQRNKPGRKLPKSGYRGVYERRPGQFQARGNIGGTYMHLGCYPTAIQAARAYDTAILEHFGEGYPTNASLGLLDA